MAGIDFDAYEFECPVCIEEVDDTWKMLPCQHNFCLRCLEKIYEASRSPQCPTCRKVIMVSIHDLPKPILLFSLFERFKASRNEKSASEEDFAIAIERSIDEFRENEHLRIALRTSADEAVIEAERDEGDLTAVMNFSLREHKERELNLSRIEELELRTALLTSEKEFLLASEERLKREIATIRSVDSIDDDQTASPSNAVVELIAKMECVSIASDERKASRSNSSTECSDMIPVSARASTESEISCSSQEEICYSSAVVELTDLFAGCSSIASASDSRSESENSCYVTDMGTSSIAGSSEVVSVVKNHSEQPSLLAMNPVYVNQATDFHISDGNIDAELVSRKPIDYEELCAYVPSSLNVPDMSNYLRVKHRQPVLDTIVVETTTDAKLNTLRKKEVSWYLETVDDYLDALKPYRRDLVDKIAQEFGNDDGVKRMLAMENRDDDHTATVQASSEETELALALELSRQTYFETDEETLLNLTLRKSEVLDPIEALRAQFLDIKEKLHLRMGVIESEESN